MRDYQVAHGVALAQSYNTTMYILVGFLLVGLLCNMLVTPVDAKHHAPQRAGAKLALT